MANSQFDADKVLNAAKAEVQAALPKSTAQYHLAQKVVPGGTTRSRFWWPMPIYIERGSGAHVTDIDGRRYIDCNLGFGPLILGHAHPAIEAALSRQLPLGVHYGAACLGEEGLARRITENLPGAERVIFLNSGTEATLAALRIARAATGRDKVAKFEGGWHGAQEFLFHNYTTINGEPAHVRSVPDMAGIPRGATDSVVVLPYNDPAAFTRIREESNDLACVIVEAVQGGGGSVPVEADFLRGLRQVCDEVGALLIIDEVITGFRIGAASAAGHYGITGDLTTLGKIIGGGLPVGAVAGRADLIELTTPIAGAEAGKRKAVVVAGTFAANPMTMAAGIAQIDTLVGDRNSYETLNALGEHMRSGLTSVMEEFGIQGHVTGLGSMWGVHFTSKSPKSPREMVDANHTASRLLSAYLLLEGILMSSPAHLGFLSTAHSEADVDAVIQSHRNALERMMHEGVLVQ